MPSISQEIKAALDIIFLGTHSDEEFHSKYLFSRPIRKYNEYIDTDPLHSAPANQGPIIKALWKTPNAGSSLSKYGPIMLTTGHKTFLICLALRFSVISVITSFTFRVCLAFLFWILINFWVSIQNGLLISKQIYIFFLTWRGCIGLIFLLPMEGFHRLQGKIFLLYLWCSRIVLRRWDFLLHCKPPWWLRNRNSSRLPLAFP